MIEMTKRGLARRAWRKRRVEIKLCVNCPSPIATGKNHCEKCLNDLRERTKERLAKRKMAGVCVRCQSPPVGRMTMCRHCLGDLKARRKRRLIGGRCAYCPALVNGKTICPACSKKRRLKADEKRSLGICTSLGCANLAVPGKASCSQHSLIRSERLRNLKQTCLNHYGQKCNCPCGCTVTNLFHLTIDHKNNDGATQRREQKIHGGHANYRRIINSGFPDDLQVLCWNCNCAKHFYGGCK